jgi:Xaa-Pro dipeptidase
MSNHPAIPGRIIFLSRISRRGFLTTSAAVFTAPSLAAQAPCTESSTPPRIAALPNLSGQARPFTNAERQARIERARQSMVQNQIDAIVLANSTSSSVYFADLRLYGGERLWALVLPARAKPFLICPAFEAGRAHELLSAGPLAADCDILTWQEDESPYVLLGKGLSDRGLSSATVGLDERTAFVFCEGIRHANPKLNIVSATPVTAGCRMIKSPQEIECMRLACRATLLVYRAVAESLHPGMTTADVHALIAAAYHRVGFEGEASLNVDEFTALPHGSRQPQTLREGSILMLDDGCSVEGYQSDITRTFVLGKPTDKMKSVFELVRNAQSAALHTARPGVSTADVDAAARKIIVNGGYGPAFKFFTHRVGHGIGLDGHEWPYFVRNNMYGWELNPKLQTGMTLSDEPGIYIPGEFGIRLEDDLLVTEAGAELLSPQCPSLENPFANVS